MSRARRILLLAPENTFGIGFARIPNLGLGYAAAAAQAAGFSFDWMDAARAPFTPEAVVEAVSSAQRREPYTAIGMNVFTASLGPARKVAQALARLPQPPPLLIGGPHPTFEPEDSFKQIPGTAYAFQGECEEGLGPLLEMLYASNGIDPEALARIPNLVWRKADGSFGYGPRSFPSDLDRIGRIPWDKIRPDLYPLAPNGIFSKQRRIAPLIATRGCPYTCTFCGAPESMGKKMRTRSPKELVDEIEWLQRDFDIHEIHFMDDNFTLDRPFLKAFCNEVIRRGVRFDWACPNGVRLNSLNEEVLPLMERAGCYSFAVGIESGSQRVLDLMEKRLTLDQIESAVRLIKKTTRIRVTGFFVIGIPGETKAEVEQTIAFAKRLPLDRANFFNYSPFPGSPIYDQLKREGRLTGLDLSTLYIHRVEYASDELGRRELQRLQRRAYMRFYLRPRVLWGLLREIRSLTQVVTIGRRAKLLLAPAS